MLPLIRPSSGRAPRWVKEHDWQWLIIGIEIFGVPSRGLIFLERWLRQWEEPK
jgi:hypothetical protein